VVAALITLVPIPCTLHSIHLAKPRVVKDVDVAGVDSSAIPNGDRPATGNAGSDESSEGDVIPVATTPSQPTHSIASSSGRNKRDSEEVRSRLELATGVKKQKVVDNEDGKTRGRRKHTSTKGDQGDSNGSAGENKPPRSSPRKGKGSGKGKGTPFDEAHGEHNDFTAVVGQKVQVSMEVMSVEPGEEPHRTMEAFVGTICRINQANGKFQVKWDNPNEKRSWYPRGDTSVTALPSQAVVPPSPPPSQRSLRKRRG
jgi:hypothetical protein